MFADFSQGRAHSVVRVQLCVVLLGVPFSQRWEFLRNGREEADNDTHRCGFHIRAKFVDNLFILEII